jgi:hypothetical protein
VATADVTHVLDEAGVRYELLTHAHTAQRGPTAAANGTGSIQREVENAGATEHCP